MSRRLAGRKAANPRRRTGTGGAVPPSSVAGRTRRPRTPPRFSRPCSASPRDVPPVSPGGGRGRGVAFGGTLASPFQPLGFPLRDLVEVAEEPGVPLVKLRPHPSMQAALRSRLAGDRRLFGEHDFHGSGRRGSVPLPGRATPALADVCGPTASRSRMPLSRDPGDDWAVSGPITNSVYTRPPGGRRPPALTSRRFLHQLNQDVYVRSGPQLKFVGGTPCLPGVRPWLIVTSFLCLGTWLAETEGPQALPRRPVIAGAVEFASAGRGGVVRGRAGLVETDREPGGRPGTQNAAVLLPDRVACFSSSNGRGAVGSHWRGFRQAGKTVDPDFGAGLEGPESVRQCGPRRARNHAPS